MTSEYNMETHRRCGFLSPSNTANMANFHYILNEKRQQPFASTATCQRILGAQALFNEHSCGTSKWNTLTQKAVDAVSVFKIACIKSAVQNAFIDSLHEYLKSRYCF